MQDKRPLTALFFTYGSPSKHDDVPEFVRMIMGKRSSEEIINFNLKRYSVKGALESQAEIERMAREVQKLLQKNLNARVLLCARFWHPFLHEVIPQLEKGEKVVVFITTVIQTKAIIQPYLQQLQKKPDLSFKLLFQFHKYDDLIEYLAHRTEEVVKGQENAKVIFTAHSLPVTVPGADEYSKEFRELADRIASTACLRQYQVAFQSIPQNSRVEWLAPSVMDVAEEEAEEGRTLIFHNLNFFAENVETLYDLDIQVRDIVERKGGKYVRLRQPGRDSDFAKVIARFIYSEVSRLNHE